MEVIKADSVLVYICYFPEPQFLYVKLKENVNYSLENVIKVHEAIHEIKKDVSIKILINIEDAQYEYFPKESMKYLSENPYSKFQVKKGILIKGLGQKIFGNFYLTIFKPKVKTRLFTKIETAIEWLEIKNLNEILELLNN